MHGTPLDGSSTALVLPVANEQLGHFISKLLGTPQVIERRIAGPFEVNSDDIINIHQLLAQRIFSQNRGTEIDCKVRIEYIDGSSIEINGIQNFKLYAEVRAIVSTGVSISIVYLLHFEGSPAPERQQIDVSMRTLRRDDFPLGVLGDEMKGYGRISYRIQHTQRTWGFDIENLMNHQLQSLIKETRPTWMRFLTRHRGYIAFASVGFYVAYCTYALIRFTEKVNQARLSELKSAFLSAKSSSQEWGSQILSALELVFELISSNKTTNVVGSLLFIVGIAVFIILAIAIVITILNLFDTKSYSYILLTRSSREYKEIQTRDAYFDMKIGLMVLVLNFVVGIFGNLIAAKLG